MRCIKTVVDLNCNYCQGLTIKFGKINGRQRYRCKTVARRKCGSI